MTKNKKFKVPEILATQIEEIHKLSIVSDKNNTGVYYVGGLGYGYRSHGRSKEKIISDLFEKFVLNNLNRNTRRRRSYSHRTNAIEDMLNSLILLRAVKIDDITTTYGSTLRSVGTSQITAIRTDCFSVIASTFSDPGTDYTNESMEALGKLVKDAFYTFISETETGRANIAKLRDQNYIVASKLDKPGCHIALSDTEGKKKWFDELASLERGKILGLYTLLRDGSYISDFDCDISTQRSYKFPERIFFTHNGYARFEKFTGQNYNFPDFYLNNGQIFWESNGKFDEYELMEPMVHRKLKKSYPVNLKNKDKVRFTTFIIGDLRIIIKKEVFNYKENQLYNNSIRRGTENSFILEDESEDKRLVLKQTLIMYSISKKDIVIQINVTNDENGTFFEIGIPEGARNISSIKQVIDNLKRMERLRDSTSLWKDIRTIESYHNIKMYNDNLNMYVPSINDHDKGAEHLYGGITNENLRLIVNKYTTLNKIYVLLKKIDNVDILYDYLRYTGAEFLKC